MTTTEKAGTNRVVWCVFAGLAVVAVVCVVLALRPTPQIGTDEAVFKTVDALYTAVRNRDEKRLGECETRLHQYRAAGSLPEDACGRLDGVIAQARSGKWESAAERLYDFIRGQQNGPEHEHAPKKPKPAGAKK